MAYKKVVELEHHEVPGKINLRTGEVTEVSGKDVDNGMDKFRLMKTYTRFNTKAWRLLETQTSKIQYIIATKLAMMSKAYTSSLVPLNDDTTATELADILNEDRRTIMKHINKLFKLGVIAKFEVYEADELHHKYWVFNPYLTFNGSVIKKDVPTLFDKTTYALIS